MNDRLALKDHLQRLNRQSYKAYKSIAGSYDFGRFALSIDHVQGDPFAAPSRLSAQITWEVAGTPDWCRNSQIRRIALADYLTRVFATSIRRVAPRQRMGTGKSGEVSISRPGQQILERNSVVLDNEAIDLRFTVGLPAQGRRILGSAAVRLLTETVPNVVESALLWENLQPDAVGRHVESVEDQEAMRAQLSTLGLVSFVANGAVLPRRSGVDDRPLTGTSTEPFLSPPELACELGRPNGDPIPGMGVPEGVTLIAGGGFHGKSTLLRAIETGVYNHIPGDGREQVVTRSDAVKVRAEDGRSVVGVNISPFLRNLPGGTDTESFSTPNASGSTSQAASIVEAMEAGTGLLLMDEDTSATNFLIRDARMQRLVPDDREPITPFIDWVRPLFDEKQISSILALGGSGDYLDVADYVIVMDAYRPIDAGADAKRIVRELPTDRRRKGCQDFPTPPARRHQPSSLNASRNRRPVYVEVRDTRQLLFGREVVDLWGISQIVAPEQLRAIGWILHTLAKSNESVLEAISRTMRRINQEGLDCLIPYKTGNLTRPRTVDIAATLNRMRSLRLADPHLES